MHKYTTLAQSINTGRSKLTHGVAAAYTPQEPLQDLRRPLSLSISQTPQTLFSSSSTSQTSYHFADIIRSILARCVE